MSSELEERIRSHARSFDSLLSLIPAKLYYGEDVSDQWKRKKQTPEQKRAAKMAKLDPDNWKSAKDVMDERSAAAKRKRDEEQEEAMLVDGQNIESEQPKQLQDQENPKAKKRKLDKPLQSPQKPAPLTIDEKKQRKADKRAAKKEKAQKAKEKLERQKARKQAEKEQKKQETTRDNDDGTALAESIDLDPEPVVEVTDADQWSTASSREGAPDILSPPAESASSSSSIPPSVTDQPPRSASKPPARKSKSQSTSSQKQPTTPQPPAQLLPIQTAVEREAAKERLANAISSFRSARKADEPDSVKPRNRAELLEQRRQKEEAKRLAKKEQKRKEREEAARREDEEIARRFSPGGSGSLLGSPRSPPSKDDDGASANNFSYGRIEFSDGSKIDSSNLENGILPIHKKKGPQDAQTALKSAQNKASRLSNLNDSDRQELESKDMWLAAKRRAHGERVKDNSSLLKKALKRQEGQKKKSENEWTDRKEGLVRSQEAKQKKRTDNLTKRKDDKMARKVGKKGTKVKKRPGFEGSFRGRTGGGKKKS